MTMRLPIVMLLALAAAPLSAAEPDAKPKVLDRKSPDYVRCEKRAPIGSMIKSVKLCRTNAEWERLASTEGKEARDLVERNQGRPPGN